jgi:hypothetical protein
MLTKFAALFVAAVLFCGHVLAQGVDEQGRVCLNKVPPSWAFAVLAMTSKNESSGPRGYAAIAGDSDQQGMSVGFLQWNFASGTMNEFLKLVSGRDAVVASTMPTHGARWIKEAMNSSSGSAAEKKAALTYIRNIQKTSEREKLYAELTAFLNHKSVQAAQDQAASARGEVAWGNAKKFAAEVKLTCRPHFAQFALFYDYNVQAGTAYVTDLTQMMIRYRKNKNATVSDPAPEERKEASHYLAMRQATWIMGYPNYAPCRVPSRPYNGHTWESEANCAVWRDAMGVQSAKMESWQTELFYVATITAALRKADYVEDFGNRKGMLALGLGYGHGNFCDYTSLYRDLDEVGVPGAVIATATPEGINARVAASCKLAKPAP